MRPPHCLGPTCVHTHLHTPAHTHTHTCTHTCTHTHTPARTHLHRHRFIRIPKALGGGEHHRAPLPPRNNSESYRQGVLTVGHNTTGASGAFSTGGRAGGWCRGGGQPLYMSPQCIGPRVQPTCRLWHYRTISTMPLPLPFLLAPSRPLTPMPLTPMPLTPRRPARRAAAARLPAPQPPAAGRGGGGGGQQPAAAAGGPEGE